jgi:CRP/FNR family transcriptional regulator, anaerobic regulatory protein
MSEKQKLRLAAGTDSRSRHNPRATVDSTVRSDPCTQCAIRSSNICSVLLRTGSGGHTPAATEVEWQIHKKIRAHTNLKSVGEQTDRVYVICEGWAFRFAQLPDGRKQILSILIPGDLITPTRLFDDTVRFSVQAMTEMRYCGYSRSTLRTRLTIEHSLLDAWAQIVLAEHRWNIGLVVDLGSRSAGERIAHLILALKVRLEKRGMTVGNSFSFPLTQRLIAEATGLTQEHVNRVIGRFRREGLTEHTEGFLQILDLAGLQRLGALNF